VRREQREFRYLTLESEAIPVAALRLDLFHSLRLFISSNCLAQLITAVNVSLHRQRLHFTLLP
jgi:hypothetical protein